jgi:hypothetical protein
MHGEFLVSIIEFYRIDHNNPGDWYSNPCRYFFENIETTKIDVDSIKKITWSQNDTLIVGGGGLIGNSHFDDQMRKIATHPDEDFLNDILNVKLRDVSIENKQQLLKWKEVIQRYTIKVLGEIDRTVGPRVLWGVGHNTREMATDNITYPSYVNMFHLVGIRDWDSGYRWVPCASCMHPAFDKEYEIKNEFVWFEHKKRLIDNKLMDLVSAPRMINSGQNLEQILEFLGSGETVVTNSYHGVYWATLLKRKVICIPWGNKFNGFKHPPVMATEKDWPDKIGQGTIYPDALDECREANIMFNDDVQRLLKKKSR